MTPLIPVPDCERQSSADPEQEGGGAQRRHDGSERTRQKRVNVQKGLGLEGRRIVSDGTVRTRAHVLSQRK